MNININRFISLKCSVDMMLHRLFPNAKEITESFGAYEATKHLEDFEWGNRDRAVVCVGDGHTPRTGGTFAYRTAWQCYSIDPLLKKTDYAIRRLKCFKRFVQDDKLILDVPTLICCVHSHAKLSHCLEHIVAPKIDIINIPCCVKPNIRKPNISYNDVNIWSEKNLVELYLGV